MSRQYELCLDKCTIWSHMLYPRCSASVQGLNMRSEGASLSVVAVQPPRKFPCSLDPSPTSSSDASGGAGNPANRQLGAFSHCIIGPYPQMKMLAPWVLGM